jgi:hypothetical protein
VDRSSAQTRVKDAKRKITKERRAGRTPPRHEAHEERATKKGFSRKTLDPRAIPCAATAPEAERTARFFFVNLRVLRAFVVFFRLLFQPLV